MNIRTLQKKGRWLHVETTRFIEKNAHITYAVRVFVALGIGLVGIGSVYAFSDVDTIAALRSSLTGAVSGAETPQLEIPIVLSGISVVGEVVPERELALSTRASGVLVEASARVGDRVRAGTPIFRIEREEAERAVQNAELALERARTALDATEKNIPLPSNNEAAARAENARALSAALKTGYTEVSDILLSLPDMMTGLSGILYGGGFADEDVYYLTAQAGRIETYNPHITQLLERAKNSHRVAKESYEKTYNHFHQYTGVLDDAARETLVNEMEAMVQELAQTVDAAKELLVFLQTHYAALKYSTPEVFVDYEESLSNYAEQLHDQRDLLLGTIDTVQALRTAFDGETNAAPSSASSADLRLDVRQAALELTEAQARLAFYEVQAPFDGVIARLDAYVSEYVSDGETVALIVSDTRYVRVALAEGEAARVHTGTRALVSIPETDITVPGVVHEMDVVGKKDDEGYVYFEALIGFPKPDERVKPGMNVMVGFETNS